MTQTQQTPVLTTSHLETWQQIDPDQHDVRLVVCDMDGTLLDNAGKLPVGFDELVETLDEAGIPFVPASGRPYPTLNKMFTRYESFTTFVAENGSLVMRDGDVISMSTVDPANVRRALDLAHASGRNLGVILCGRQGAWVERADEEFVTEVGTYFTELTVVDDLAVVDDDILKVAIYDFGDPNDAKRDVFSVLEDDHQVVVSATHWIDIMAGGTTKGTAVQALQESLGVTRAQTVAFGDFFNDAEMLDAADLSFAIGNAHPGIRARARYVAPTNAEYGVVTVLEHLLGS